MDGKTESLMKLQSRHALLEKIKGLEDKNNEEITEEEKYAILFKDMLLKLEQDTHPIFFTTLFHNGNEALQYVQDIEQFEAMLNDNGLTDDFIKPLESEEITISSETSEADIISYYSAPINIQNTQGNIKKLVTDFKNPYLWNFNWNTALEEEVDFNTLETGDFFTAMALAISIRLSRLQKLYTVTDKSIYSPLALMITALTSPGEDFMWIVKGSVKLLAQEQQAPLFELLTIPNDIEGRSPYSGPLGVLLHGVAHAALDSGLTMESLEIALKESPQVIAFLQLVFETKESLPEHLQDAGEVACFIKGLILPNLGSDSVTDNEVQELINALIIMGEMSAIKNTEYSMHSSQWQEYLEQFYGKIV